MSNRINDLVLPVLLVVLLMFLPCYLIAAEAGFNPSPLTAAWTAGEWVVDKMNAKPKISFAEAQQQAKEDWNADPYACMWERNWIRKYKKDIC